jgi:hypothetical protein
MFGVAFRRQAAPVLRVFLPWDAPYAADKDVAPMSVTFSGGPATKGPFHRRVHVTRLIVDLARSGHGDVLIAALKVDNIHKDTATVASTSEQWHVSTHIVHSRDLCRAIGGLTGEKTTSAQVLYTGCATEKWSYLGAKADLLKSHPERLWACIDLEKVPL